MKICFITFYYPPDLCAGSFRAEALSKALLKRKDKVKEIEIFTTTPNRYSLHHIENTKQNLNFIALEEVTDPRNIGSIIRSAVAFGIDGIIVKERSFPYKSKLLYKSASGGTEHIKIFKVSNINTTLKFLKTKGFWVSAFDISASKDFTKNNWDGKNVLLFGSEGFGIKAKTLDKSDFKFRVKINNKIESLNISNTVSVVCHHIFQSIKIKK